MLLWVLQKGRQEEEQGWRGQERACGSLTAAQCRTKQSVAGAGNWATQGKSERGLQPGRFPPPAPPPCPGLAPPQKSLSQTAAGSRLMMCCSSRSVGAAPPLPTCELTLSHSTLHCNRILTLTDLLVDTF